MSTVRKYLNALFGDTKGVAHIAVASGPHYDAAGKYSHANWSESRFQWPDEADIATQELLRACHDADVYVCVHLMHADKRHPAGAVERKLLHFDVDGGNLDLDKVRQVGGFAVGSGSDNNGHVYIPLTEAIPANHYETLERAGASYFAADNKIRENDVLRPAGTLNHKAAAAGGEPASVGFLILPPGSPADPRQLAETFGVTLPLSCPSRTAPKTRPRIAGTFEVAAVNLDRYPSVKAALDNNSGDRSSDTMRIVGTCHTAGLSLAHTRWVVGQRADLAGRLAERNDDDIQSCWLKVVDSQQGTTFEPPVLLQDRMSVAPVDGAELLGAIDKFLARFVVYPSDSYRHLHVLWITHTHLMDCWDSTPRIAFLSPEPGSGKSRALEVTEPLVPRPVHAVNTTPAYLFRKVADPDGKPTILYDEIDTVFGPRAKDNEDIRGMLNAGHRKGAVAGRCLMRGKVVETEELDAYCAVALAGLDDLPDTIMTRSVIVRMRRRSAKEKVEPWRHRVNASEGAELGAKLAVWADSVRERAADYWPEMPDGVADRAADVAEALLSVADIAGGHWPVTSRVAVVAAVADLQDKEPSAGVRLLHDIHSCFSETAECSAVASELVGKLKAMEEGPWATLDLDNRKLARRLAKYGIRSKNLRQSDGRVLKGYRREDFADAWERYLTSTPLSSDKSATAATTAIACRSTDCGKPLTRPDSIAVGVCQECRLFGGVAA